MTAMRSNNLEAVVNCLQREPEITIIGHSIPDGDCAGSCLGMGMALRRLGKTVEVVMNDPVPRLYDFLSGYDRISTPAASPARPVLLYLDCADQKRVGALPPGWADCVRTVVNVDHHVSNTMYGDYNWVKAEASSTAEICLQLLDTLGVIPDAPIANALYTGIIMDTGSFQYDSTSPATMRSAARLLEYGADKNLIRQRLYESKSWTEMRVLSLALQNLHNARQGRIAWIELPLHQLTALDAADEHYEGIINYPRSIVGVEVGMLFREVEPGMIKVGFRSRGQVDVNQIAARFGGGGHRLASGARVPGSMEQAVDRVVREVEESMRCLGL